MGFVLQVLGGCAIGAALGLAGLDGKSSALLTIGVLLIANGVNL